MDKFVTRKKRKSREDAILEDTASKYFKTESDHDISNEIESLKPKMVKISDEGLDCDYGIIYSKSEADTILEECEKQLQYNTGRESQVQIFGRWHDVPRKQVAHGEPGLSYTFSGKTVSAKPWIPFLTNIRDKITQKTGYEFNFVLINRYKDGNDYIGEHRDDEKDLVLDSPIASLSLGQKRDFIFKHAEARGKGAKRTDIKPVKVELEHGGLLMMNYPTNKYWYHSLPKRKGATSVRINMTFRKMVTPVNNN